MRLLVVEGDTHEAQARLTQERGATPGESYAEVLRGIVPEARIDLCSPAERMASLPCCASLADYDGVALTGSALHVYDMTPEVTRQIDFARALFASGTPIFGSCWGLQVLSAAAGGAVRRNPKGREMGFGRAITLRSDSGQHPLIVGRPDRYDALSVHVDEVGTLPPGARILASNEMSEVQALEIRHGNSTAWGVQYHPEFTFAEMAQIARRIRDDLIADGHFETHDACEAWCEDLDLLEAEPDHSDVVTRHGLNGQILDSSLRRTELRNWIAQLVRPTQMVRQRAAA
jgi:GMP synthase (glutamine-hydrolysing)